MYFIDRDTECFLKVSTFFPKDSVLSNEYEGELHWSAQNGKTYYLLCLLTILEAQNLLALDSNWMDTGIHSPLTKKSLGERAVTSCTHCNTYTVLWKDGGARDYPLDATPAQ